MSEGDTIHRLARRISAGLGGELIETAEAPSPRSPLRRTADRLQGQILESAEARGKHLLLIFDGGLALRSHLKMSGSWQLREVGGSLRKPRRRAWLILRGANGREALQFDGPELELLRAGALHRHPRLARLGPDILDRGFDPDQGVRRLRAQSQDRELGEALLDQSVVAGIGNVYKSEGCFAAELDPWCTLGELSDHELFAAIEETANLMRTGLESGRMPRRVYRLARRPCPRCGTPIRSRGQGDSNRVTYWCPRCQRSVRDNHPRGRKLRVHPGTTRARSAVRGAVRR